MSRKKRLLDKQKKRAGAKKYIINPEKQSKKKKVKKMIKRGQAHVQATYNNTIVTITDLNGAAIGQSSAGSCGFKGPKKATPYASSIIVKTLVDKVKNYGLQEVDVYVRGVGAGREAAVRALHANGLNVLSIKDMTPIPHNGCRSKKPRRV
ncbi:MAG: 30S ribosomal protein S11 [Candidatus Komeilibacteria bacterium CG_4_10_14_0_2_um_filter_37_10]|uniref:Small ribosomal subunit protein uS11 n=1 Tax=Candidatus Komeilibacteria bacterium CG_4_10_14_0_2_um_filter_37_10 TaxID=1974470 RepID=A0A2M7VDT9_9BACT|nr:MAG: 30S ribosomal protein S11 [Candidatus Komeilibacteria bacterium CG_4_10_14_0_2_um_filter_37_10]